MDGTGEDELAGELYELTRQLRGQLLRHASLGAWAAPGTASERGISDAGDDADPAPPVESVAAAAPAPGAMASAPTASGHAASASERAVADLPASTASLAASAPPATPASTSRVEPAAPASFTLTSPGPVAPSAPLASPPPAARAAGEAVEPAGPALRRTLPQIREDLGDCTRCKLHSTRRSIVFGVGAADTPLMFVGEAPGEQEDRRGEPFVGPAGELLDKMIEAMGWTRKAVYIANTTKCRPPGNRNPQPDELSQCMPFLHAQIASIAPRIIVALGRPASNQLLEVDAPISSLRGKFHDYPRHGRGSLKIMPTFHPAYLLRDPSKKRLAWDDLKLVMAELARLGITPPGPPGPPGQAG